MNSSINITKLQPEGLNYGYWSAYLEALLEENNIILSDKSFEELRAKEDRKEEYRKLNGMAKRIIMQTVSDDHISYIKSYKNADEIWMKMQQKFGSPSDAIRIEKIIQLFNHSKNNDSITKYIEQLTLKNCKTVFPI